jgi:quercetin dioxygenase-like cupin family protein
VLLRGAGSGGQFGALVFHHAVIAENPPHAHQGFAKLLYILDGQHEFRVGDAAFSGGPGSLILVPQGSQHAFTTATGGRVLFRVLTVGQQGDIPGNRRSRPAARPGAASPGQRALRTAGLPGAEGAPWRPKG